MNTLPRMAIFILVGIVIAGIGSGQAVSVAWAQWDRLRSQALRPHRKICSARWRSIAIVSQDPAEQREGRSSTTTNAGSATTTTRARPDRQLPH